MMKKDVILETILNVVNQNLGRRENNTSNFLPYLTKKDKRVDLLDLGLDSIMFVSIVVDLETAFSCEIPDDYLIYTKMNTVNKMFRVIKKALSHIH